MPITVDNSTLNLIWGSNICRLMTLLKGLRVKNCLKSIPERNIQVELYRVFKNIISQKFSYNCIEFVDVKFEPTINGRPDLVIEAFEKGKKLPLLVIETKRKVPFIDRKFDPYSKDVIRQAIGYAVELGAPYFATCNGDVFVLFDTFTVVPFQAQNINDTRINSQ